MTDGAGRLSPRVRRLVGLAVLAGGALLAAQLLGHAPAKRVLRVGLGRLAPEVTELEIRYVRDGEVERSAELRFPAGKAPRTVRHEAELADGDLSVEVAWTTSRGRAETKSRVTLGPGTSELDVHVPDRESPMSETP